MGYPQSTIWHYNERFNDLLRYAFLHGIEKLSKEFITRYLEDGAKRSPKLTSSSTKRKSLLNLVATAFNVAPIFSCEKGADEIENMAFRKNIDAYEQHLRWLGKSNATIKSYLQTATKLLYNLDRNKKHDISKVSAIDIRDFIVELSSKWSARSLRIVSSHLRTYLKFAGASYDAILASSFNTPCKSKPIRAMANENIEALWQFVEGDDADFRSKAIVALLLATGMRPVDITGLMLDDINWSNDTIGFIQSKTGEYMSIRLFPVLGSAIASYMIEQRPKGTGLKYIFLKKNAPYNRLTPSACNRILKEALKKANIDFIADGLHSPRAVRRSLVSRMIANGIPVQKAAAAIGHVDEKSVDLYTELDIEKMKSICLSIPKAMNGWCMIDG
jgi:site-specific recombinase XerD